MKGQVRVAFVPTFRIDRALVLSGAFIYINSRFNIIYIMRIR
jgi:hypothetical protein